MPGARTPGGALGGALALAGGPCRHRQSSVPGGLRPPGTGIRASEGWGCSGPSLGVPGSGSRPARRAGWIRRGPDAWAMTLGPGRSHVVILDAEVITLDPAAPRASAIAMVDGRIVAVGEIGRASCRARVGTQGTG